MECVLAFFVLHIRKTLAAGLLNKINFSLFKDFTKMSSFTRINSFWLNFVSKRKKKTKNLSESDESIILFWPKLHFPNPWHRRIRARLILVRSILIPSVLIKIGIFGIIELLARISRTIWLINSKSTPSREQLTAQPDSIAPL